ncbi:hypothetical protein TSAR_016166 [Trichomalopsis sarcophagae]|uniref:EB domain-containing protein n=1 Tax=Trichomalopsis sarcophagae TaxID=543379 RepID=A0A232FG54_9HYME|nr:hypothetical protein TSAR_016166 [Trichomalopsis sarcophagae]
MKSVICVVFLFVLSIRADTYLSAIPCRNDQGCNRVLAQPSRPICLNGICMCPNITTKMYQHCSNKDIVVSARFNGEDRRCSIDMDCKHIIGAKCFKSDKDIMELGTCDCQDHMVLSDNNQRCLKIANEVMDKCNETIQCTMGLKGAECNEGICRCWADHHYAYTKKQCIPNKAYGEACTHDEESCYQLAAPANVNALGCSDKNVCTCRKNFRFVGGICQASGYVASATRTVIQLLLVAATALFAILMF